jgi:hypothetical protein
VWAPVKNRPYSLEIWLCRDNGGGSESWLVGSVVIEIGGSVRTVERSDEVRRQHSCVARIDPTVGAAGDGANDGLGGDALCVPAPFRCPQWCFTAGPFNGDMYQYLTTVSGPPGVRELTSPFGCGRARDHRNDYLRERPAVLSWRIRAAPDASAVEPGRPTQDVSDAPLTPTCPRG